MNRKFRIIKALKNPVKILLDNKTHCEFLACGSFQFILHSAAVLRQTNGWLFPHVQEKRSATMLKESNSLWGIEHSTHEDGTDRNTKKKIQREAVQKPRMMQNLVGHILSKTHALCTKHAFQEYIGVGQIFRLRFTKQWLVNSESSNYRFA